MKKWIEIIIILVDISLLTVIAFEAGLLAERTINKKKTGSLPWVTVGTVVLFFVLLVVIFRGKIKRRFERCLQRLRNEHELLEEDVTPSPPAEEVGGPGRRRITPPEGGAPASASGRASADPIPSSSASFRPKAEKAVQRSCPELSLTRKFEVGGPKGASA